MGFLSDLFNFGYDKAEEEQERIRFTQMCSQLTKNQESAKEEKQTFAECVEILNSYNMQQYTAQQKLEEREQEEAAYQARKLKLKNPQSIYLRRRVQK